MSGVGEILPPHGIFLPKKYHVTQWSTSPRYDILTMSRIILQQNIGYRKSRVPVQGSGTKSDKIVRFPVTPQ